jgi:Helix-turn-helix domain
MAYPNFTTAEAAEILGVSPWTLVKWRAKNCGPDYVKFGARVFYRPADLQFYAEQSVHVMGRV